MAAEVSMTKGSIARQMIFFAVPIFLGELFQQLYNTADSFIVGNFAGPESLAAVASSMSLIQLLVGFFNGMAMFASVVISQSFGAQNYKKMSEVIHSTVLMGIVISIVLTAIGMWATPSILEWMGTPADVMDLSVDYLEIIFAGMTGLVMYHLFSGIMRAVGDSKTPLYFLIFTSMLNCVLDVIFVAGFGWGVKGAGWATILCQFLSALLAGIVLMRCEGPHRIDLVKIRFYPGPMWEVIRFGFPTAVQNCIISFANVFVQSNINAFGSSAMAGSGVYSKIEGFVFLPIMSFNMAISTFVGQNIGALNRERTRKGARFGVLCSVAAAEAVGILFFIFAPELTSLFVSDPAVIAYGVLRARNNALFYFLLAFSHAVSAVLRGSGKPAVPMFVMLFCWCAVRILLLSATAWMHNFTILSSVYPITWSLSSIYFLFYWKSGKWMPEELRTSAAVQAQEA